MPQPTPHHQQQQQQPADVASVMASISTQELASHSRRVSKEDLARVTPEDIDAVMKNMSQEQYKAVLRAMAEHNRYGDVVKHSKNDSFEKAMDQVSDVALTDAALVLSSHVPFQSSVMANMTAEHKGMCQRRLQERHKAAMSSREGK